MELHRVNGSRHVRVGARIAEGDLGLRRLRRLEVELHDARRLAAGLDVADPHRDAVGPLIERHVLEGHGPRVSIPVPDVRRRRDPPAVDVRVDSVFGQLRRRVDSGDDIGQGFLGFDNVRFVDSDIARRAEITHADRLRGPAQTPVLLRIGQANLNGVRALAERHPGGEAVAGHFRLRFQRFSIKEHDGVVRPLAVLWGESQPAVDAHLGGAFAVVIDHLRRGEHDLRRPRPKLDRDRILGRGLAGDSSKLEAVRSRF